MMTNWWNTTSWWNGWLGWLLALVGLWAFWGAATGCKSSDRVANLDATLEAFDKHKVAYRGKVAGPVAGQFEMYSGGRMATGGWLDIEISNSALVPTKHAETQ